MLLGFKTKERALLLKNAPTADKKERTFVSSTKEQTTTKRLPFFNIFIIGVGSHIKESLFVKKRSKKGFGKEPKR